MTKTDLIKQFPWTNQPSINAYAEKFTLAQWEVMSHAGVPEFLTQGLLDPLLLSALFESILQVSKHPLIEAQIRSGETNFEQIVKNQLEIIAHAAQQQSLVRPQEVMDWFGSELTRLFEQRVESYEQADNLIQVLSSSKIRDLLAGDRIAMQELPSIPQGLTDLKGQDVRHLLKSEKISFQQLFTIASELSKPINRKFPDWIDDNLELRKVASEFSDLQLAEINKILDLSIRRDRELKCSFLRSILLTLTIHGQSMIQQCPDLIIFKQLVIHHQKQFLQTIQEQAVDMASHLIKPVSDIVASARGESQLHHSTVQFAGESAVNQDNPKDSSIDLQNHLIRKFVPEYKKIPLIPIPTDIKRRQEAFGCALRNAANQGEFWSLLLLIIEVPNINEQGVLSGKTALHCAATYASRTGERLCFELLSKQPGIDFSLRDREGKTALDYWDFKKCPDAALHAKWVAQQHEAKACDFK